jgi:hypothetical protein
VQHQQDRAGAFVDVVHDVPVQLDEVAGEREQRVVDPRGSFADRVRRCHAAMIGSLLAIVKST